VQRDVIKKSDGYLKTCKDFLLYAWQFMWKKEDVELLSEGIFLRDFCLSPFAYSNPYIYDFKYVHMHLHHSQWAAVQRHFAAVLTATFVWPILKRQGFTYSCLIRYGDKTKASDLYNIRISVTQ